MQIGTGLDPPSRRRFVMAKANCLLTALLSILFCGCAHQRPNAQSYFNDYVEDCVNDGFSEADCRVRAYDRMAEMCETNGRYCL